MKSRSLLVCLLLAVPALAPGASKEIQELQRDIALLQQQIKDLQTVAGREVRGPHGAGAAVDRGRQRGQYQRRGDHQQHRKEPARPDRQGRHPRAWASPPASTRWAANCAPSPGSRRSHRADEPPAGPVDRYQQRHQSDAAPPAAPPPQPGQPGGTASASDVPPMPATRHVQRRAAATTQRQVRSGRPGVHRLSEVLRQHRASRPTRSSTSP